MKVVVIGGTSSGVGKTSVSVGLMCALRNKGLTVQAFKVGPDFLDPMHHEKATGRPSVNLDGWLLKKEQNIDSFHRAMSGADVAVVEGVMGLFDGRDGKTEIGSTAEMAKWLGAPVLLVVDCWALARSAAAMVKGYEDFDKDLMIGGVILNKVGGEAHGAWLREALETSSLKIPVLGGIPKDDTVVLKERHLGLHRPLDNDVPSGYVQSLGSLVERNIDLAKLLDVAASAVVPPPTRPKIVQQPATTRIAIAKDAAFCFYYAENLQLLREAGAELVFFSPLTDDFPENVAGLYLGGGYPELYASELSERRKMRAAVKALAEAGGVVYAECGGLLYLSQSIQPLNRSPASMVGVFPFRTHMTQNSMKMGYVQVSTQPPCALFPAHHNVRGHVYHFSEILQERVVGGFANGSVIRAGSPGEGWEAGYKATLQTPGAATVEEGFTWRNVLASYVHLHFGSNPGLAAALVARCNLVDVDAVGRAVTEAKSRVNSLDIVPPTARMSATQSSPNLQGLQHRSSHFGRARSVDFTNGQQPGGFHMEGECDLEESFRRAEAARAMSMDVSHVPGVDCWQVKGLNTGTSGTGTGSSISSTATSPTKSSFGKGSPFAGTTQSAYSPAPTAESETFEEPSRDGGSHASTSGQEELRLKHDSSLLSLGRLLSRASTDVPQLSSQAIVSLLPSGTEILFALGLKNRVIGVTDLCDHPREARSLPKVSRSSVDTSRMSMEEVEASMQAFKSQHRAPFEIDGEFLARYQPGLLLTQDVCHSCDPSTSMVLQALEQAGLLGERGHTQVLEMNPRTMADILDSILEVGLVTGMYGEAVRLVDKLRARLRAVAMAVAKQPCRPRVLSLEGLKPLCLGGQWLPEMKELAGGNHDWQQGGDPPLRITWDQVREYEPEVLILSPCSCSPSRALAEVTSLAGLPGWWALPAVRNGQVYIVDHAYFCRPGPRIVDGVEILARILHPEVLAQRAPEDSVLKLTLKGGQRCRQRLLQNYFVPFQ